MVSERYEAFQPVVSLSSSTTPAPFRDLAAPPGNKLRELEDDLAGKHAIWINSQWRIVFRWTKAGPEEVEITDYH